MIRRLLNQLRSTDTDEPQSRDEPQGKWTTDSVDESTTPHAIRDHSRGERELESIPEIHQGLVAPGSIEEQPNAVRIGESLARTQWVAEYPDSPTDGLFETLYSTSETRETDVSIHVDPRNTERTLNALENKIEDLEADVEYLTERHRAGARGIQKDLEDYQDLYDVLRNTSMGAFDVSMYLTTRERDPTAERVDVDGVRNAARRAPANLTPVTPRWQQLDSLVATSPIGTNKLDESLDASTPMLGGAVGAMFPFVSGAFAEPGIEYGTYALNESPLILDRFARETGYCMMVIGKLGAGKSFSTKLQLLRRAMYDSETIIVMLDPLEGFAGVNQALGGERVTVGGTRGFNPLELRATPASVLASAPDLDPWGEQIAWVLTFFETFFTHVAANPLGDRTQTLRRAVQETYADAGITRDPATHGEDSPTITDLIEVLESLLADPSTYGYPTDGEQERIRQDAESLLTDLRPSFRPDGDFANLARPSEFDLDAPVVYLDLNQEEGVRGNAETSLMMQVLFNAVYERAKGTDKRVVFVIDEAHYLMHDSTSLGFLETAVRHSRHYDLSLQFVTQTGGEFALTPEAKTIASLCSMTLIHRVDEEAEKLAQWFGLNDREINWVRSAKAGNDEDGFSEALLGIDEAGWFPLRVRASPYEQRVLDQPSDTHESSKGISRSTQDGTISAHPDGGDRLV
ncbi:VirB4 family type IV secretion system protein [Halorubellus salinus]|uniref:VirB4 family type IV secretion system protein n=1 Tax=Halorubellus salinus TaxID=755309 RepID=UPI003F5EDDD4